MATNKNAQVRYRVLDECFKNRFHRYTIDDLVDKVNYELKDLTGKTVSLRQIRADINFMKDSKGYDAPIKAYQFDGKKCYYRYTDPDFSIFESELSTEDAMQLHKVLDMLGRYRGIPANGWLDDAIVHLEQRFGLRPQTETFVSFDDNMELKGREHLSELIDATVNKQPLEIHYRTYKGKEFDTIVHPYYLKQYNSRWFLVGYDDRRKRIQNYALDRIEYFLIAEKVPFRSSNTNFEDYFKDVIGVSVPYEDVKVEHVILRFSENRFPYVVSKKLHPSQQVCNEPYTISIDVKPTRELEQQIFSFGPDVEVLEPVSLREDIKKKIEETLKKYSSVKDDCTKED